MSFSRASAELRALAALAIVSVVGWFGYQMVFSESSEVRIRLEDVQGIVQIERAGGVSDALTGSELAASDRLRAGPDGSAVLSFGEQNRVSVAPNTSVQVTAVDDDGVQLSLEDGRVKATIRPDGPSLALTAKGQTITANDADFSVGVSGDQVGVTSERGSVQVSGQTLAEGRRLVFDQGTPLQLPVSDALLLSMGWPDQPITRAPVVRVSGRTEPKARLAVRSGDVTVNATADAVGKFEVDVPLTEGENALVVVATNIFGQASEATWQVTRDSTPPTIGVTVQ